MSIRLIEFTCLEDNDDRVLIAHYLNNATGISYTAEVERQHRMAGGVDALFDICNIILSHVLSLEFESLGRLLAWCESMSASSAYPSAW